MAPWCHAGLCEVPCIRLRHLLLANVAEANLHRTVIFLLGSAYLRHYSGPCLDDCHRNHRALLGENLSHPNFPANNRFDHNNTPVRSSKPTQHDHVVHTADRLVTTAASLTV